MRSFERQMTFCFVHLGLLMINLMILSSLLTSWNSTPGPPLPNTGNPPGQDKFNIPPAYYRRCKNCNPHNYNTLIDNPNICAHKENYDDDVYLIVHVFSRASNRAARDAIRATWASPTTRLDDAARRVRYAFLFGRAPTAQEDQALRDEAAKFGDVLQEDYDDYYNNLVHKSMMSLHWATRFCAGAKFVVRIDDDVIFNAGNLVRYLEANPGVKVGGRIQKLDERIVIRDPGSKWFVPRSLIPCPMFPEFMSGLMYVISLDAAARIYEASPDVPGLPVDDVYTTGILALEHLGIPLTDIPEIYRYKEKFNACAFRRKTIMGQHTVQPDEMRRKWEEIRNSDCRP